MNLFDLLRRVGGESPLPEPKLLSVCQPKVRIDKMPIDQARALWSQRDSWVLKQFLHQRKLERERNK